MELTFNNSFLQKYLTYTDNTESAKIYHIWCAISSIGATMSTNIYLPFGPFKIYPNQYIILIGPPGAKKTSAISIAKRLVKAYGKISLAPDDTGGQRQGLISAIADVSASQKSLGDYAEILALFDQAVDQKLESKSPTLYAVAEELRSLLGSTSEDTLTFLIRMFDCDSYTYKLKDSQIQIENQLLSILAATTVDQFTAILPVAAIGQGFSSRLILVYAQAPHKEIPWPEPLSEKLEKELGAIYSKVADFKGVFAVPQEVKDYVGVLYKEKSTLSDSRFLHYNQRRQTHLLKLSMCLAAMEGRTNLSVLDFEEANKILKLTEEFMPEAIGEYGIESIDKSRQRVLEYLTNLRKQDCDYALLKTVMLKEMPKYQFDRVVTDLINSKKIRIADTGIKGRYIISLIESETQATARTLLESLSKGV